MINYDKMTPEELDALSFEDKKALTIENKRRLPGYTDTKSPNYYGTLNMKPLQAGSDRAKRVSQMGADATKESFLKKAELQEFVAAFRKDLDAHEGLDSLQVMRAIMAKHLMNGDDEAAHSVAKDIAKYEHASLQSIDSTIREVDVKDLTDEELEQQIAELDADNVIPIRKDD